MSCQAWRDTFKTSYHALPVSKPDMVCPHLSNYGTMPKPCCHLRGQETLEFGQFPIAVARERAGPLEQGTVLW